LNINNVKKNQDQVSTRRKLSRGKLWLFRIISILVLPLLLFCLMELGLILGGYGRSLDFTIKHPVKDREMIVSNPYFTDMFFGPRLARDCDPFAIPLEKEKDTYRIFVIGGSAALGFPDSTLNMARLLDVMLRQQYPGVNFDVVNVAITAINSHVLVPIARSCSRLAPDLFIVYAGNNEVVGPYGAGTVFTPQVPGILAIRTGIRLKRLRIGQLQASLASRLNPEADTRPRGWQGLEMFMEQRVRSSSRRLARVYSHYEENLRDICRIAEKSGAEMILSTVGVNMRDCAPFASLHKPDMDPGKLDQWDVLFDQGRELEELKKHEEAVRFYLEAAEIDDTFAELEFRLGRCYQELGELDRAAERYEQARDLDVLRFRADRRINEIVRGIAEDGDGIYLADAARRLKEQGPHQSIGREFLLDHVHLNFSGNFQVAQSMLEQVRKVLPDWIFQKAGGQPVLTEPELAAKIVYTPWDQYNIRTQIHQMIMFPPFISRTNNDEMVEYNRSLLEELGVSQQEEKLQETLSQYEAALKENQTHRSVRVRYAFLQGGSLKNMKESEEAWRRLIAEHPLFWKYYFGLGKTLAADRRFGEAIPQLERALELRPFFDELHWTMGRVLEKHRPDDEKTTDRAISFYKSCVDIDSTRKRNRDSLANALFRKAGRSRNTDHEDEAYQLLNRALEVDPEDAGYHHTMGNILSQWGDQTRAEKHYRESLRLAPDSPDAGYSLANLFLNRAKVLLEQTKVEEAEALLQEAIKIHPDLAEAHYNLAILYHQREDMESAIHHLNEILRSQPDNEQVLGVLEKLNQ
jgi:tetratricopeptide (TPR) repeat protein